MAPFSSAWKISPPRDHRDGRSELLDDLAAEARESNLEPRDVGQTLDGIAEPASGFRADQATVERMNVIFRVELFRELAAAGVEPPGAEFPGLHAEWHGGDQG